MNGKNLIKELGIAVTGVVSDLETEILDMEVIDEIETAVTAVVEAARADAEDTEEDEGPDAE